MVWSSSAQSRQFPAVGLELRRFMAKWKNLDGKAKNAEEYMWQSEKLTWKIWAHEVSYRKMTIFFVEKWANLDGKVKNTYGKVKNLYGNNGKMKI